jgi:HlyD family secretion protein
MPMLDTAKPAMKNVPSVAPGSENHDFTDAGNRPKRPAGRRLLLSAVALVVLAAAVAGAWSLFFRPIAVQVARPESNVAVQVFGLGTVEARITSKIGFKVSGVLVDLRADVGDRVAKGVVLAGLDDREQRAQVARAKATVEQTEAGSKL